MRDAKRWPSSRGSARSEASDDPRGQVTIVVGVVGGLRVSSGAALAVVGYVAMQASVERSRTSEGSRSLQYLYTGASAYYAQERWDTRVIGSTVNAQTVCTVDPAVTSNAPGSWPNVIDWTQEPACFGELGFDLVEPAYYQYEIAGPSGRCRNTANTSGLYTMRSRGDLDEDGVQSLFEIPVRSDAQNLLQHSPVEIQREGE